MTRRTDAELLAELRTSPEALDEFYRRHRERVLHHTTRRCRQPADVADLVAATFLAVLSAAASYGPRRGNAEAWLVGIARNQWARMCRGEDRQARLATVTRERSLSTDDYLRLEEQIDASRESEAVERALARIGDAHREVLLLIGHDDLSIAEAGTALGVSQGTLRVRLLRARRALRAALDEDIAAIPFVRPTTPQEASA